MIIYVQHLQICFESGGTVDREKAGYSLPYKVYGAESAFLILISDLYDPVGPPLTCYSAVVLLDLNFLQYRSCIPLCKLSIHT